MSAPLGVALFGTGRIGTIHLQDVLGNPRLRLLWLVEADVTRAQHLHQRLQLKPEVRIADIKRMELVLATPSVKCVLVCTPTSSHEDIVKAALNAGKAVFCEKPLAVTLSGVVECYQLAKDRDLPLFCAFNRRYDPQVRAVYDRVRQGDLGKLRVVKTTSRDPPAMVDINYIRGSGGIFVDSGVHDIDLLCWLVGEFPHKVYATGHATDPEYAKCGDVDTCYVTLNFPSGVIGNFEISRAANVGYDQRLEVFGTKGMLQTTSQSPPCPVYQTGSAITLPAIHGDVINRYGTSYRKELEHFVDLVEGKVKPEVTAESTTTVNIIAAACKASLDSETVIHIKDFDPLGQNKKHVIENGK